MICLQITNNNLNRRKNCFSQLLNERNSSDVRQKEEYPTKPLLPGPSCLEV
jgi:hypothetical protein